MVYAVENGQTRPVASVHWSEPNARLIAAAPEMLDEIAHLADMLANVNDPTRRAAAARHARALLAKIEGK